MRVCKHSFCFIVFTCIFLIACNKKDDDPQAEYFNYTSAWLDQRPPALSYRDAGINPEIRISFSEPVDRSSVAAAVTLHPANSTAIPVQIGYENGDSTLVITSPAALKYLTKYTLTLFDGLTSVSGKKLSSTVIITFTTRLDPTDKFPLISDTSLVQLVQQQTFKYFWDFAHPNSGMARERNTSGDVVTTGGTGFGIMAIVVGVERGFTSRQEGYDRVRNIVDFLETADRYHGAFPHWLNESPAY